MKILRYFLLVGLLCNAATATAQAEFGRFYTTPKQRQQLDEARNKRPQAEIIVEVNPQFQESAIEDEEVTTSSGSISLDGLVYRSDGKNTAWINRGSTNEGNIESQFTNVDERDVRSNHVNITLPGSGDIQLKVGQQYDVNTRQVQEMKTDPAVRGAETDPGATRPPR